MSRKVKFSVSIEKIAFSYEGDSETGEAVQRGIERTLGGIVEMQNRAMGLEDKSEVLDVHSTPVKPRRRRKIAAASNGDGETNGAAGKRRGIPAVIEQLINEGFMSQERSVEDVRGALGNKGTICKSGHVSTLLKTLVEKGVLLRKQNEDSRWVYWAKTSP